MTYAFVSCWSGKSSSKWYEATNARFERMSSFLEQLTIKFLLPLFIVPPPIQLCVQYFVLHSAEPSFNLAVPQMCVSLPTSRPLAYQYTPQTNDKRAFVRFHRLPYDWRSPVPFIFTSIIEAIQVTYVGGVCIIIYLMFFGVCIFLGTFVEDLERNLNELNAMIEEAADRRVLGSKDVQLKLKRSFNQLIRFHGDVKQLRGICLVRFEYFQRLRANP